MTVVEIAETRTPVGVVRVAAADDALVALKVDEAWSATRSYFERWFPDAEERRAGDPAGAVTALRDYFDGDLGALDRVPVAGRGTEFQRRVWGQLRRIPAGRVISYAELARRVGNPAAMRAVGSANRVNPIGIVVPCHRVVRADGSIGGYAGGVDRKVTLLRHEGAWQPTLAGV